MLTVKMFVEEVTFLTTEMRENKAKVDRTAYAMAPLPIPIDLRSTLAPMAP